MKAKTIKTVIRKKVDEWLASIDDEVTRKIIEGNVIVTGGSIVSMLLQEKVNDFDIYFRDRDSALAAARYYLKKFQDNPPVQFKDSSRLADMWVDDKDSERVKLHLKSVGIAGESGSKEYQYFETQPNAVGEQFVNDQFEQNLESADDTAGDMIDENKPAYRPVFLSSNSITLSNRIQIIIRFFGEPEEIHKNYDFVHCTCYWEDRHNTLTLPAAALEAMITKELRYVGSKYPLCSLIRIRKFVSRGWQINAGQILKMCMQLNELDLKDLRVLEDQLTGVDAAYFMQVISALQKKQEDEGKVGEPVDGMYLMTIIDRLF